MELRKIKMENGWHLNREYMPLGYNNDRFKGNPGYSFLDMPIYTKYKRISEKLLLEIAHSKDGGVQRNEKGEIHTVFLYNDGTNPMNRSKDDKALWDSYFEKLKKLSKLKIE